MNLAAAIEALRADVESGNDLYVATLRARTGLRVLSARERMP